MSMVKVYTDNYYAKVFPCITSLQKINICICTGQAEYEDLVFTEHEVYVCKQSKHIPVVGLHES